MFRAGDDGGEEAGHSRGEHVLYRVGDGFVRAGRIVIIHAGEAVHLQIDKSGRDKIVHIFGA